MALAPQLLLPLAETTYGTAGVTDWVKENVVSVVLLILAVLVLWAARGGNVGKGITIMAGMLMGLLALGLATGNNGADLGAFLVGLLTKG
jgi:hypothetical protein